MDIVKLITGIFWFTLGHIFVFFQLNGQFKWDWFKKNELEYQHMQLELIIYLKKV